MNELKRYANLKPEDVRDITESKIPGGRHDHRHKSVLVPHRPARVKIDQFGEVGRTDQPG